MKEQKYLLTPIHSNGERLRTTEYSGYTHEAIARSDMCFFADDTLFRVENTDTHVVNWFRKVCSHNDISVSELEKINECDILNLLYGSNEREC